MFDKFLRSNARDWVQRYQGTYGKYHKDGRSVLCYLSKIDLDSDRPCLYFKDSNNCDYHLYVDNAQGVEWEFLLPESKYYNTPKGVYYIQRRAARQFQRGISNNNTIVNTITGRGSIPAKLGFDILLAVDSAFTSVDAYDYHTKWGAVALSSQICLAATGVYVASSMIGTYTWENASPDIQLVGDAGKMFMQEVKDSLTRNGIKEYTLV